MTKPFVTGISGLSGCGKSTVAQKIAKCLDPHLEKVLVLSMDDLHKYSRGSNEWDLVTHLNPDANNLELGESQLSDLIEGKSIWRSFYSHETGNFEPPVKIAPKAFIINEGLHAFFGARLLSLTDLRIYVDTDPDLLDHWKIIRDVSQRGQSAESVREKIKMRQIDHHFVENQKALCDFIFTFRPTSTIENIGCPYEIVEIEHEITDKKNGGAVELVDLIDIIKGA